MIPRIAMPSSAIGRGTVRHNVGMANPAERRPLGTRSALTPRAAILTAVVALVVATVALPMRDLVAQRNRINALRDRQAVATEELKAMNARIARWNDPAFVAVQARERLHFVLPGQVGYVVLEADNAPLLLHGKAPSRGRSQSWYAALWGGIKRAGRTAAPAPSATAPARATR